MYQIQAEVLPRLENLIQYTFNDKSLGWQALQCKGAGGYAEGNKRIALVGDAYLKTKLLVVWFPTGGCTKIGHDQVQKATNSNLSRLGQLVGLQGLINSNPSQQGMVTASQIADTVEAIVGAVYVDGGEEAMEGVMGRLGLL